jgi:hypothetical protein
MAVLLQKREQADRTYCLVARYTGRTVNYIEIAPILRSQGYRSISPNGYEPLIRVSRVAPQQMAY